MKFEHPQTGSPQHPEIDQKPESLQAPHDFLGRVLLRQRILSECCHATREWALQIHSIAAGTLEPSFKMALNEMQVWLDHASPKMQLKDTLVELLIDHGDNTLRNRLGSSYPFVHISSETVPIS